MKLYVWENVLTDYTSGIMFALANSIEEARELIIKKEGCEHFPEGLVRTDLKADPDVYDQPCGFTCWGGG